VLCEVLSVDDQWLIYMHCKAEHLEVSKVVGGGSSFNSKGIF